VDKMMISSRFLQQQQQTFKTLLLLPAKKIPILSLFTTNKSYNLTQLLRQQQSPPHYLQCQFLTTLPRYTAAVRRGPTPQPLIPASKAASRVRKEAKRDGVLGKSTRPVRYSKPSVIRVLKQEASRYRIEKNERLKVLELLMKKRGNE
jgi:hypothetical protein